MTNVEFEIVVNKYEKTDIDYYNLLIRIELLCKGNFYSLFEKAELTNKKLYLIKDTQDEMEKTGLMPESFILIDDIGVK